MPDLGIYMRKPPIEGKDKVRRRLPKGLGELNPKSSPRTCLKRPGVVLDEPGSAGLVTGGGLRSLRSPLSERLQSSR